MDELINEPYRLQPGFSDNPGNLKRQRFAEDAQVRLQAALRERPPNIGWFEDLMRNRDFSTKQRPRVGYLCNMIPQELAWALGADAVRLDCGNAGAALVGEEMLSGEICPLAKASFGVFMNKDSMANSCDVVALPTSCDAKKKLGQILDDIKPAFMLALPPEQDHRRYADVTLQEMVRLVGFLETHLKTKLKSGALLAAVKLGRRRSAIVRKLQAIRMRTPRVMSFRDVMLVLQGSQFRPVAISHWITEAEKVVAWADTAAQQAGTTKGLKPRLVLTGAPLIWPNYKVLNVLEECGAEIVADTLCTGEQSCFDPVVLDETGVKPLLRALTNRSVFAAICPCFTSQTTRLNRIISLVEESAADGVVNHSLRLCQLFDMETYRIEKVLKARKVAFLNIRTDYSLEDTEQLRVRIEAFLETV
ncbi:MAG: 2-hydroxyacyl-CoA dehydratase family protein [Verrucomicrobia bacterium]|nr:2-hydroxyacyl-CoA dehydratase family protein [Verrucomicrobiota bacterium]MBU4247244.1 2-hydroxyacyl-CoA dehydratase family protein [Verrucomicrobiota bacterium]MBU4289950.1 2-hydroxyacyl-CoA dehydratase family protein [Verrucomicrobiota bacterium]MBU4498055.1 2-hydroxyacyl-CoA dehydratase family protein [Verrucomicrobiota bacterium]MCG2679702.1 2-hydroxyacyl-CoA dehydratase family protein [Kiritimatiellia bacterium]